MLKVLELFGGIGACTAALKRLDIEFEVADYVEIDKFAVKSYNAINSTNFEPQDIKDWDKNIKVDLIMHGSPCQDFSIAGKQAGGDEGSKTRSSLMYETVRITEKLQPKYVIWENVKNVLSKKHKHNFNSYLSKLTELGYENYYQVLNAKDYGVPQNRERVFVVSIRKDMEKDFKFPEKKVLKLRLKDLLEEKVDNKYYYDNEKAKMLIRKLEESEVLGSTQTNAYKGEITGVSPTLTSAMGSGGGHIQIIRECCDSTINKPKIKNISNCIVARYDNGISNQKSTGCAVIEKLMYVGDLDIKGNDCIKRVSSPLGIAPILTSMGGGNTEPKILDLRDTNWKGIQIKDIYPAQRASNHNLAVIGSKYRVRKLTPKECWRLMGRNDEDIDKCINAGISNTQLYRQAGNSIVVNVIKKILENLLVKVVDEIQTSFL